MLVLVDNLFINLTSIVCGFSVGGHLCTVLTNNYTSIQFVQKNKSALMVQAVMAPLNCSTVGSLMMLVGSASQSRRVLEEKLCLQLSELELSLMNLFSSGLVVRTLGRM